MSWQGHTIYRKTVRIIFFYLLLNSGKTFVGKIPPSKFATSSNEKSNRSVIHERSYVTVHRMSPYCMWKWLVNICHHQQLFWSKIKCFSNLFKGYIPYKALWYFNTYRVKDPREGSCSLSLRHLVRVYVTTFLPAMSAEILHWGATLIQNGVVRSKFTEWFQSSRYKELAKHEHRNHKQELNIPSLHFVSVMRSLP